MRQWFIDEDGSTVWLNIKNKTIYYPHSKRDNISIRAQELVDKEGYVIQLQID